MSQWDTPADRAASEPPGCVRKEDFQSVYPEASTFRCGEALQQLGSGPLSATQGKSLLTTPCLRKDTVCVCVCVWHWGVYCAGQLCSIAPDCIELVAGSCICQNGISHLISTRLATLNYSCFMGCKIKTGTNFEIFFSREKVTYMVSPSAPAPAGLSDV